MEIRWLTCLRPLTGDQAASTPTLCSNTVQVWPYRNPISHQSWQAPRAQGSGRGGRSWHGRCISPCAAGACQDWYTKGTGNEGSVEKLFYSFNPFKWRAAALPIFVYYQLRDEPVSLLRLVTWGQGQRAPGTEHTWKIWVILHKTKITVDFTLQVKSVKSHSYTAKKFCMEIDNP